LSRYFSKHALRMAARCIERGGVIAYPTEGVWGLGCDPYSPEAVARILALKGRALHKGLILIAAHPRQLGEALAGLSAKELRLLEEDPGYPRTWLVPDNGSLPVWITGGSGSLAVRITRHPQVAALCDRLGFGLVSTSANPAGKVAAQSALRVRQYFPLQLDFVLGGNLQDAGGASEIRDLKSDKLIRARGK